MSALNTPVAFFIFNRPEETARVLARLATVRPAKLVVIADGPRNEQERVQTDAARAVVANVNWPCEVRRDYSDVNLGCRRRMSSGIDRVFSQFDEAIFLEDDCLPEPSFFPYCAELLHRYRDDDRVMTISGDNFQFGRRRTPYSYYFSAIAHIWGWASWKRAWRRYDVTMSAWPAFRDGGALDELVRDAGAVEAFRKAFDRVHGGAVDTWDTQWTFAHWLSGGLCILPEVNLVSNIGFGPAATHTRSARAAEANLATEAMPFPLRHPPGVQRCAEADAFSFERMAGGRSV